MEGELDPPPGSQHTLSSDPKYHPHTHGPLGCKLMITERSRERCNAPQKLVSVCEMSQDSEVLERYMSL